MAEDGTRKGDSTARGKDMRGEAGELATTRIVTRAKRAASEADAEPDSERYDFLDGREPEFMWQPVTGRSRAGEGDAVDAPGWLERSRASKRRSALHNVLASLLTVAVIAAIAAAAFAVVTGKLGTLRGLIPASGSVKAPAAKQPAAAAPQPERAPSQDTAPAPAEGAGKDGGGAQEQPATTPPPGGEDGPPAAEPGAPERGER